MPLPAIALPEARNALRRAADQLADLLRSLPNTGAPIPRSNWTIGNAAAHVVVDLRTETLVAGGEDVSWAEGARSVPGTPRGVGELNARAVTAEAERDPRTLASVLVIAVSDFLAPVRSFLLITPCRASASRVGWRSTSPGSPASIWERYWYTDMTLPRPRGGRGRLPRTTLALRSVVCCA
jgi:hypothetical protein